MIEWSKERIDLAPVHRKLWYEVIATFVFFVGGHLYFENVTKTEWSAILLTALLFTLFLVFSLPLTKKLTIDNLLRSRVPSAYRAGSRLLHVRIDRDGVELGRDYGVLWADGPVLCFEGLSTAWQLSNREVENLKDLSPIVQRRDDVVWTVRFLGSAGTNFQTREMVWAWRTHVWHQVAPLQSLPLHHQSRTARWFITKVSERMIIQSAILIVIGTLLPFGYSQMSQGASMRLSLLLVAAMIHTFVRSLGKVRRDDEANLAWLRQKDDQSFQSRLLRGYVVSPDHLNPQDGNLSAARVVT